MIADSLPFRILYRYTPVVLILVAVFIGVLINLGQPLTCLSSDYDPTDTVEALCWPNLARSQGIHYEGLDELQGNLLTPLSSTKFNFVRGYLALPWELILAAAALVFPKLVWNAFEAGKMRQLVDAPSSSYKLLSLPGKSYFLMFYFCQLWAISVAVARTVAIYPTKGEEPHELNGRCTYSKFGPSGTIQKHDVQCMVTIADQVQNMVYYVSSWMVAVVAFALFIFVVELLVYVVPALRRAAIDYITKDGNQVHKLGNEASYSDVFWLRQLSAHCSPEKMDVLVNSVKGGDENSKYVD